MIKTRREKQKCQNDPLDLLIKTHPKLYIWGPPGIGKTWTVRRVLDDFIDLDADILKSKQTTLDILSRASSSLFFIDDFEAVQDLVGIRELEQVKRIVIIGNNPWKGHMNVFSYEFPIKSESELLDIGKLYGVYDVSWCGGDIRRIINGQSDAKDVFWTPKNFVHSLISVNGTKDSNDYIGHIIEEHGHVMDMIHDNYIDSKADPCEVLECLSIASVYDDEIYSGKWYLLPYFSLESCIAPASLIGHSITGDLRPGSMWTKYSSMCMRKKKVRAMCNRVKRRELDVDALMLLRDYFDKGQGHELIQEYDLHKCDFDVLAHLCLVKKLKAKTTTALKKQCLE